MKFLLVAILGLAVIAASAMFYGWIVMLVLGALASIFEAPNLAIGFWTSCLVGILLSLLTGGGAVKTKD